MKVRTDFVTNSSSSAFVLSIKVDFKGKGKKRKNHVELNVESDIEGGYGFYDMEVNDNDINAKKLAGADSTHELISMIDHAIDYHFYTIDNERIESEEYPVSKLYRRTDLNEIIDELVVSSYRIEDNREFFEKLEKLEMSDICKITIDREKYLHSGDSWMHRQSYNLETKEFVYDKDDQEPEDEG